MASNESNNGLYFIVGALVVVAVVGFMMFANNNDLANITPSAGSNYSASAPAAPEAAPEQTRTETELRVNENGVSSTTTRTDQE